MPKKDEKFWKEMTSLRDTVESVWVAIVLAFVLRAFMVEAFVIPTGSMAPRLLGEHWDLRCESCGYEYAFGWGAPDAPVRGQGETFSGATCPTCWQPYDGIESRHLVNSGDRVLVMKYLYHFADPQPWDVIVFRNPQSNRENYIKRVVGLPGETIEIVHGDVFVSSNAEDEASWRIRRKPPRAQRAMWQIVFNNDYRPSDSQLAQGRIPRWRPAGGASQWRQTDRSRRFLFDGGPAATLALHSHRDHFLPNYAYNRRTNGAGNDRNVLYAETDVCGDLKLSAVLVPRDATTQLSLLLYTGREELKAVIAAEGRAGLFRRGPSGDWVDWGTATVDPLTLDRGCQVSLANADYRATVSVGGKAVIVKDYDAARDHGRLKERLAAFERHVGNNNGVVVPREVERLFPTPRLAVQAEGGRCELLHVKVFRDVYYTCRKLEAVDPTPLGKYARDEYEEEIERATNVLGQEQDGPTIKRRGWGVTGRPIPLRDDDNPDLDEFFVLGDNSPASLDGRSWTRAAPTLRLTTRDGDRLYLLGTVPRYNLIGKAIFVYWPSGFRPPGLPALPIIPNVGRMRLIR